MRYAGYPKTSFIGHANAFWANISADVPDGVAPNTTLLKGPKVMVCATVATMKLCVTGDAAE